MIILKLMLLLLISAPFLVALKKFSIKFEEEGQLITLFVCMFIIFIIAILISFIPSFYSLTADYNAKLVVSKDMTLSETYVYHVFSDNYRGLYRQFSAPLFIEGKGGYPLIPHYTLLSINSNYPEYAVDCLGRVSVWNYSFYSYYFLKGLIERHAKKNQCGIVNPRRFTPGDYMVRYMFTIYPIIQTDGKYEHVNLKLASEHIPYTKYNIIVSDPKNKIVKMFVYAQGSKVVKSGDEWIITGKSPENGLIGLEMLLKPNSVSGEVLHVNNILEKTINANKAYKFEIAASNDIGILYLIVGLCFPLIVYIIYRRYGREINVTVPKYLSYVPNKNRKPWLVNLAFKGDPFAFDIDGFFSTLLDLDRRGLIKIEQYKPSGHAIFHHKRNELKIKIIGNEAMLDDEYEEAVFKFIKKYSKNGVFDSADFKSGNYNLLESRRRLIELRELITLSGRFTPMKEKTEREFIDTSGRKAIGYLTLFSLVFAVVGFGIYYKLKFAPTYLITLIPIMGTVTVIESFACLITSPSLFGRWKGREYEERLQWHAFARFLSNMAMIKKYEPEDVTIWKEWLVYGTALGVGKTVAAIMKTLNVHTIDSDMLRYYDIFDSFYVFYYVTPPTTGNVSGFGGGFGSFGGGFGGCGGFGGGGAGGW